MWSFKHWPVARSRTLMLFICRYGIDTFAAPHPLRVLVGFRFKIYGTLKEGPNLWSSLLANECKPGLKPWFSELKPWIAMVVSCIFLLILLSSIFLAPEEAVDSSVTQLLFTYLPSHQPFWCQDALKFSANTANHTVRTSCVDSPTGLFRAWDTNF